MLIVISLYHSHYHHGEDYIPTSRVLFKKSVSSFSFVLFGFASLYVQPTVSSPCFFIVLMLRCWDVEMHVLLFSSEGRSELIDWFDTPQHHIRFYNLISFPLVLFIYASCLVMFCPVLSVLLFFVWFHWFHWLTARFWFTFTCTQLNCLPLLKPLLLALALRVPNQHSNYSI